MEWEIQCATVGCKRSAWSQRSEAEAIKAAGESGFVFTAAAGGWLCPEHTPGKPTAATTFEAALSAVLDEACALVISKQLLYGHDNLLAFGEVGVVVRASDKVQRLKHLLWKVAVPTPAAIEATDDAWIDLLGYAALALMLRRGTFTLPLAADTARGEI